MTPGTYALSDGVYRGEVIHFTDGVYRGQPVERKLLTVEKKSGLFFLDNGAKYQIHVDSVPGKTLVDNTILFDIADRLTYLDRLRIDCAKKDSLLREGEEHVGKLSRDLSRKDSIIANDSVAYQTAVERIKERDQIIVGQDQTIGQHPAAIKKARRKGYWKGFLNASQVAILGVIVYIFFH